MSILTKDVISQSKVAIIFKILRIFAGRIVSEFERERAVRKLKNLRHSLEIQVQQKTQELQLSASMEEIIGKTAEDFSPTIGEVEHYHKCDQQIITTGQPLFYLSETLHKPDGSVMWGDTNKMPLRNLQGEIIGLLGTYEDITIQKKAEENLRQQALMFQYISDLDIVWKKLILMVGINLFIPIPN